MSTINEILISTESVLVSKKLIRKYTEDVAIAVQGFNLNRFLGLVEIKVSEQLESDIIFCFDSKLKPLGIIKTDTGGNAMIIKDTSSKFSAITNPEFTTHEVVN